MTDAGILSELHDAFASCERPEHFTDFRHCCECAEHDDLLRSRDRDTLQLEDVGKPGWDPLCFTSAAGLLYLMPAMGRLALDAPSAERGWYAPQLHFHLTYDGPANRILVASSMEQRRAVVGLLRHIVESRAGLCEDYDCRDDLLDAVALWEPANHDGPDKVRPTAVRS
jgi:hypothetical protein